MALAFAVEQFSGVFRDYNTALWPAQCLLVALAIVAWVAVPRPRAWSGVPRVPPSNWISPVLWCGIGAQAAFFLGMQPDFGLIAAGWVGIALLLPSGNHLRTLTP